MSSDESDLTPESIKLDALGIVNNLLPEKSKEKYLKAYDDFHKWKTAKGAKSVSERMESKSCKTLHTIVRAANASVEADKCRRNCGCLRTSDKLRNIIKTFPSPPPPTPEGVKYSCGKSCVSAYCTNIDAPQMLRGAVVNTYNKDIYNEKVGSKSWRVVYELVQLVQLSVTATALALYYLIYCYMQVVYYMLRSALYFHQADGPMKITIGVVTVTSLVVGFNIIVRMEKLIGVF